MEKSQFDSYTDGVVIICQEKEKKTDFGAKLNPKGIDDFKKVAKLNYQEMSIRNQDKEFAEQLEFSLTMKIKTRKVKNITAKHLAVIGKFLYSIKYIDKDKRNLYLYMEGVRELAE